MPSIREDLSAISKEITKINNEAKEAAQSTKSLGNELKLDPKNLDIIKQRYASLANELDVNTKKIVALQTAEADLKKLAQSDKYKNDEEALKKINALMDDYRVKLSYAVDKQKQLQAATSATAQAQSYIKAATEQVNERFAKLEKSARKLQITMLAVVAAMTKVVKSAVEQGTELYSLSKRYQTTADEIQTWNRALQLATGQADLFTQSLSIMVKGMAQIAAGRGVAFQKALKNIGIAYKDIKELSAGEQFEAILKGLSEVENYSTRAAAAQQLLGESGQYIADVFENGEINLAKYTEKAKTFGIISQENAKRLAELGFELEAVKSTLAVAGAELTIALAPTIEFLGNFLKNIVAPVLNSIAKGLKSLGGFGSALLIIMGSTALLLPKIITFIKLQTIRNLALKQSIDAVTAAQVKANLAMSKFSLISGAVGIGIMGISALIGAFRKNTDDLNDSLADTVEETKGLYGTATQGYSANTETTATSLTTKTVEIGVDIYGHGDTNISDQAAVDVSQLVSDEIQKAWGDIVG